jgi:polyisoprenoid-binding protein YceI
MRVMGVRAAMAVLAVLGIGSGAPIRLVLAPDGTEARYRVREQLAELSLPSDAVGVTHDVTGRLVLDEQGRVVAAESKFTANLATLKSDRDRRDSFIKRRTLQTDSFPTAVLAPRELKGAPNPLPSSGAFSFDLVGDLTIHGVTKATLWHVTALAKDGGFTGTATTRCKFEDFGMTPPRVAVVLSVEDEIRLELQFHLVRQGS